VKQIYLTNLRNGLFRINKSVVFWYLRISINALEPGRYLRFFLGLPVERKHKIS